MLVQFLRRHLCYFPGETAAFHDLVAAKIIASGKAVVVGPDGALLPLPELVDSILDQEDDSNEHAVQVNTEGSLGDEPKADGKDDIVEPGGLLDPFTVDGLDLEISAALHNAGLHSPEDVQRYLMAGSDLTKLKDIGAVRARHIKAIYVTE